VVELYESGKVAASEANLGEYLKVRARVACRFVSVVSCRLVRERV
jgi:hypothetical protein